MNDGVYNYHGKEIPLLKPLDHRHSDWEAEGLHWKKTAIRGKRKYSVVGMYAIDIGKELPKGYLGREFELIAVKGQNSILVIFENFTWDGSTWSLDRRSMLASLVHDALCVMANDGYRMDYVWKQAIYRDILIKQGFGTAWAYSRFCGLVLFNWL